MLLLAVAVTSVVIFFSFKTDNFDVAEDTADKEEVTQEDTFAKEETTGIIEEEEPKEDDIIEDVEIKPAKDKAILAAAAWVPQTFNNCGPASVSMILQHFGYQVSQQELKERLRTNPDDKSVPLREIGDFLKNEYDIQAKLLYNGDIERLKLLLANDFYIIVKGWLHPNDDIGHTIIIRGYDDNKGVLIGDDSYIDIGVEYPYEEFDLQQWKAFNRIYLPVYTADKEMALRVIVGKDWHQQKMFEASVELNQIDVDVNSNDMYAFFNLGTSYYYLQRYTEAKESFEKSYALGWPDRMLWYQYEPISNYNEIGEYQKALNLIDIGLTHNDSYAELHYEAARAYQGLGNTEKAKEEANLALKYNPNYVEAEQLLKSL